jgi:hypothetical protein
MPRTFLTHREQYEMLAPWRVAAADVSPSDAYDDPYYDHPEPVDTPQGRPWYHVSPGKFKPGDIVSPAASGVGEPNLDTYTHPQHGEHRQKFVWMEHEPYAANSWVTPKDNIYEVEPLDGPWPWNGNGREGWVAPGARVVRQVASGGKHHHPPKEAGMLAPWRVALISGPGSRREPTTSFSGSSNFA